MTDSTQEIVTDRSTQPSQGAPSFVANSQPTSLAGDASCRNIDDDIVSNLLRQPDPQRNCRREDHPAHRLRRRIRLCCARGNRRHHRAPQCDSGLRARLPTAQRRCSASRASTPSTADAVNVPHGYTARVLIAWGDPVSDGPEFRPDASNSAFEQEWQWGMHNDGLVYFPIDGSSSHGLHRPEPRIHGRRAAVSRRHCELEPGKDQQVACRARRRRSSKSGRTGQRSRVARGAAVGVTRAASRAITPMRIGGPAAGDPRLMTSADPTGKRVLGTLNNCAMGFTPWGTYLACEENFNGYFRKAAGAALTPLEQRYGLSTGGFGYNWHLTDARFRIDPAVLPDQPDAPYEPNEPNRFGWVVEINPFDPNRHAGQAHGARAHEARGRLVPGSARRPRSSSTWATTRCSSTSIATSRSSRGGGCAAWASARSTAERFTSRSSTTTAPALAPADARQPASRGLVAGRHPHQYPRRGRSRRRHPHGPAGVDRHVPGFPDRRRDAHEQQLARPVGTNPRTGLPFDPVDAINPRAANSYGQVVTWSYKHDFTEPTFRWDLFALAGDPETPATASTVVGDKYGSPDGIYVAPSGRLWIQTDVSGSTIDLGSLRGFRQQPDALRRSRDAGNPAIPGRAAHLRDHRRLRHAGRTHDVRRHPASGRGALGRQRSGQPEAIQFLARRTGRRAAALALVVISKTMAARSAAESTCRCRRSRTPRPAPHRSKPRP